MRRLAQAIALLAAGAAAYYAAPVALRLVRPQAKPPQPLVAITPEPARSAAPPSAYEERGGDPVIANSLAELQRHATVEAELVKSGFVLGQPVEVAGVYRQKGRGYGRKFATLLQGRIASSPARLWQVSNGLFLYTDLAWIPADPSKPVEPRRSVTQLDLRRVHQELTGPILAADRLARGEAAAQTLDPSMSAAFGGLPMLVESLSANFHFSAPRKMDLHNQLVFVMLGHWKPSSRAALLSDATDKSSDTTKQPTGAASRLPHHVLLAVGAQDLFPYLIEYRSPDDPLAAPEMTDNDRLLQSSRPMLRMEFRRPRFDLQLADTHFAYPEAGTVDRRDVTAERLQLLRNRQRLSIAARRPTDARR